jgi:hypothetical protein
MKDIDKTKFVSDVDVDDKGIKARPPFKLATENQRRFVRLEISAPVKLRKVKDVCGNFWPRGTGFTLEGVILNISPGGVLVEIDQPLNEGDIVSMTFTLQGNVTLENVLGAVKRADRDEEVFLVGIEFVNRNYLMDTLSQAELDLLAEDLSGFEETVQEVLQKYLYRERVSHHVE